MRATSSPALWPWKSLTYLKRSRSRSSTAPSRPWPSTYADSSSSKRRRFEQRGQVIVVGEVTQLGFEAPLLGSADRPIRPQATIFRHPAVGWPPTVRQARTLTALQGHDKTPGMLSNPRAPRTSGGARTVATHYLFSTKDGDRARRQACRCDPARRARPGRVPHAGTGQWHRPADEDSVDDPPEYAQICNCNAVTKGGHPGVRRRGPPYAARDRRRHPRRHRLRIMHRPRARDPRVHPP
jgi:hypothetical protein